MKKSPTVIVELVGPNGSKDEIFSGKVTVPNVVGDSWAAANVVVAAAGMVGAKNPVLCSVHTTAVRAKVERTLPAAGVHVARGSLVVFC